jgi:hypothetical protein
MSPGPAPEAGGYRPLVDICCTPSKTPVASVSRRARLAELDTYFHCSVIGTCLSTGELRKLVPRFIDLDRQRATDLEIHHAAVQLAMDGGAGCKALQKALDDRNAVALRRFDKAKDPQALLALWQEALKTGDIPPAYWAVMTHPHTNFEVRQAAFGEVHMLSHLVGAANRADIRRLMTLEEENAALKNKIERQQSRLHEMSTQHDAAIRHLTEQLAELTGQAARQPRADTRVQAEAEALREELAARDQQLALHISRRDASEQRAVQEHDEAVALRARLDDALALVEVLRSESSAMENAMMHGSDEHTERAGLNHLQGKRIVYVGGRPSSNVLLKRLVESAGGQLIVHDGGVEDRKGMLATALPRADMVVFPVDCIDHDSMNTLKRVCDRHQVSYYPLRTASLACFVELMGRVEAGSAACATAAQPVSRFCLRHG